MHKYLIRKNFGTEGKAHLKRSNGLQAANFAVKTEKKVSLQRRKEEVLWDLT